jgi:uncharacterized protein YaaR (DUF327 family)
MQHFTVLTESVIDFGEELSSTYTTLTSGFRILRYKDIDRKLIKQLPNIVVNTNLCQKPSHSPDKYHERDITMFSNSIDEK